MSRCLFVSLGHIQIGLLLVDVFVKNIFAMVADSVDIQYQETQYFIGFRSVVELIWVLVSHERYIRFLLFRVGCVVCRDDWMISVAFSTVWWF